MDEKGCSKLCIPLPLTRLGCCRGGSRVGHRRVGVDPRVEQITEEGWLEFAILARQFQTPFEFSFTDHDVCLTASFQA